MDPILAQESANAAIARFLRRLQWTLLIFATVGLVWWLSPVLTPFVVSALLGWLGDPLVDRIERSGRSRNFGVVLVFTLMVLLLVLALVILVPLVQRQLATLAESLPSYRDWFLGTALPWLEQRTGLRIVEWL